MSERPANAGLDGEGYYAGLDHSEEGDERVETVRKALGHYEFSVEAVLDLDSLAASLADAEREREEWKDRYGVADKAVMAALEGVNLVTEGKKAAEARVAALEAVLRDIAEYLEGILVSGSPAWAAVRKARAALAAGEGTEGKS